MTYYVGGQATVVGTTSGCAPSASCTVTQVSTDIHLSVNGERVASVRQGASPRTVYLYRDRLGSVVATTVAGGVNRASYRYGVYGAVEASSGDVGDAASELGYTGALRLSGNLLLMGAQD